MDRTVTFVALAVLAAQMTFSHAQGIKSEQITAPDLGFTWPARQPTATPRNVSPGDDTRLRWRVENLTWSTLAIAGAPKITTTVAQGPWTDAVFLVPFYWWNSEGSNANWREVFPSIRIPLHENIMHPDPVQPGAGYVNTDIAKIPESVPEGVYRLAVITDFSANNESFGKLSEISEDNNTSVSLLPFVVGSIGGRPNLHPGLPVTVEMESPSRRIQPGERLRIRWYTNSDKASFPETHEAFGAAAGPWKDAVFLSRDLLFSGDDLLLGFIEHDDDDEPVDPGNGYFGELETALPQGVPSGEYFAIVFTNWQGELDEVALNDNFRPSEKPLRVVDPERAFQQWIRIHLPADIPESERAREGDFDNDGIENLIEFATGLDPSSRQPEFQPISITPRGDNVHVSYLANEEALQDLDLKIEQSTDLIKWTSLGSGSPVADANLGEGQVRYDLVVRARSPQIVKIDNREEPVLIAGTFAAPCWLFQVKLKFLRPFGLNR